MDSHSPTDGSVCRRRTTSFAMPFVLLAALVSATVLGPALTPSSHGTEGGGLLYAQRTSDPTCNRALQFSGAPAHRAVGLRVGPASTILPNSANSSGSACRPCLVRIVTDHTGRPATIERDARSPAMRTGPYRPLLLHQSGQFHRKGDAWSGAEPSCSEGTCRNITGSLVNEGREWL